MTNEHQRTVAVFAPYFPPYGGGLERYAYEITARLAKEYRWRVVVITSGKRYGFDEKHEQDGMTIYRLGYSMKLSNTPFAMHWYGTIKEILKAESPDVINIHMPVPGIGDIAYLLSGKRPFIVTYHTGTMKKGQLLPDAFIWLYEHLTLPFLLRRADRIITSSDWVRYNFLKRYLNKSTTVTPAVDTDIFKPDASKRSAVPTILFVASLGRPEQYKGLKSLLDALVTVRKSIPDVRLTVAGDGDMRAEYESYVQDLGLQDAVAFRGRLSGEYLVDAYQEAHLFALPTAKDNFPLAILEAMACGLPVISTTVGDISSLVENGKTGFLVEPKNMGDLADKIVEALNSASFLAELSENARKRIANKFSWEKRTSRYDELLRENIDVRAGTRKRRILETPVRFYPYIGGVENHVYYLSEQLIKLGYEVRVICANEPPGERYDLIKGIEVKRLGYLFKIANTNIMPMFPFATWNADVEIIHTHMPTPWTADWSILIAKLRKKTSILTIHNDMDKSDPLGKFITWLYLHSFFQVTLRLADKIIIVNPHWKTAFNNTHRILEKVSSKIIAIPNGVDTEIFHPSSEKIPGTTMLFVSILDEHHRFKGFEYLLAALPKIKERMPEVKLVVVGEGALVEEYRKKARELGVEDCVDFQGKKTQKELPDYYQKADIFILPSIEIEGFGIVLLEAMASGVPVVTTDAVGIAPEIKERGAGIIVPRKDPQKLSDAIVNILGNQNLRREMAERGRELVIQNYSWEKIASTVSGIISGIIV